MIRTGENILSLTANGMDWPHFARNIHLLVVLPYTDQVFKEKIT